MIVFFSKNIMFENNLDSLKAPILRLEITCESKMHPNADINTVLRLLLHFLNNLPRHVGRSPRKNPALHEVQLS